jgi:energy-coupled thiamine transporter ThiT
MKEVRKMKKTTTTRLTESAVMLALATVLSMIKLVDLPYGGSITACSMVPIILIAYRYGVPQGLTTGLVYSLIQLLLGSNTLSYATSWQAAVAIVMLDYIIAFTVLGLAGMFRRVFANNQMGAMLSGTAVVCLLRYICHVISGCTVWAGVSIPSSDGLIYSLAYNATYMIPETIVSLAAVWYLARLINFRADRLTGMPAIQKGGKSGWVLSAAAALAVVGAIIYDTVAVFGVLQNGETGDFDITGLSNAPWTVIAVVTLAAVVVAAVLLIIRKSTNKEKNA